MQPRPRKRSRIQFQPPFLIGALGALSIATGACNALVVDGPGTSDGTGGEDGSLDGMGGPGTGGTDGEGCPEAVPIAGTACTAEEEGLICGTWGPCSSEPQVTCNGTTWASSNPTCNPPPVVSTTCPETMPSMGDSCYGYETGLRCQTATCQGDPGIACGVDGLWSYDWLACNPPGVGGGTAMGGAEGLGGADDEP